MGSESGSGESGGGSRDRQRLGPGDRDRVDSRPSLEPEECNLCSGTEDPVERSRGEPVPGEQELERGDIPAGRAHDQRAAAERVGAEISQRSSGCGRDRGGRAGQASERGDRQRPGVAVHVARVQRVFCQPDLERGDVRVADGARSGRRNERQHDGKEAGGADAHTFPIGAWT